MLIQEVGFDIVSIWTQMGWLAIGFFVALVLLTSYLIFRTVARTRSSGSGRRSSGS